MKHIILNNGVKTIVDDDDFDKLSKWSWHFKKGKNTSYAATNGRREDGFKYIRMHRLITKAPSDMQVDHIDGNGLNNSKSNLRICTNGENKQNSVGWRKSTSRYKGVCRKKNKWVAQIEFHGNNRHLGYFTNELDAALAYDREAQFLFGLYAKTNF